MNKCSFKKIIKNTYTIFIFLNLFFIYLENIYFLPCVCETERITFQGITSSRNYILYSDTGGEKNGLLITKNEQLFSFFFLC